MSRWWIWAALLLPLAGCDDDDDDEGGAACVPGQSSACACVGGGTGAQVCQDDGTFAQCVCGPAGDAAPGIDARIADAAVDARVSDAAVRDAAIADAQVDAQVVSDAQVDAQVDAAVRPHRYIAGWRDNVSSNWAELPAAMGLTGLEAGHAQCRFIGADHVCDYTELRAAVAQGELANIAEGTTAWIQRTTPEMVNGQLSDPGLGGNCVNWTFTGNHLADGEYVSFGPGGEATWHLDNDTYYDGIDMTRALPGQLDCFGPLRSLFCCNALPE